MRNILYLLSLPVLMTFCGASARSADSGYFPPPDSEGGWRTLAGDEEIRRIAGLDKHKLDEAFAYVQAGTKNGGLLVVRHGWLAYEQYFGKGHRDALCNLASCGKSFTSIALGILMAERPDLFPDGLEQKIFTPTYFPPEAFPLSDPRKAEIKLGQLLSFSAGIRGNNPCYVRGQTVTIDPPGPDGATAMVDAIALGKQDGTTKGKTVSTATLWCEPGGGYSYATSSIHLASILLRHVTGRELKDYVDEKLARPLGWGRWTYAYRHAKDVTHTPGGGGIALRATDMLRFGYLLLNEGRWKDRQLVPAEYVRHCRIQSPYNPHYPYSLQFDVNSDGHAAGVPRDAFWKSGSGYHCLYVVPSLDMVVWKLGGRDQQYSPADTGMPVLPHVQAAARDRSGWKATVEEDVAEVLARVVRAVVQQGP
jgi:CubicO group peptidase (beta-lactamase class C family)